MLNADERRRTRDELHRNLALSGADVDQVVAALGVDRRAVLAALDVEQADPVDVWRLRDHLEQLVREAGRQPVEFSVLTPAARRKAQGWFGIS